MAVLLDDAPGTGARLRLGAVPRCTSQTRGKLLGTVSTASAAPPCLTSHKQGKPKDKRQLQAGSVTTSSLSDAHSSCVQNKSRSERSSGTLSPRPGRAQGSQASAPAREQHKGPRHEPCKASQSQAQLAGPLLRVQCQAEGEADQAPRTLALGKQRIEHLKGGCVDSSWGVARAPLGRQAVQLRLQWERLGG